jgi:hypothetical protein
MYTLSQKCVGLPYVPKRKMFQIHTDFMGTDFCCVRPSDQQLFDVLPHKRFNSNSSSSFWDETYERKDMILRHVFI